MTPGDETGWHSGELWYTFGSLRRETAGYRDWQRWDYAAADITTTYWSNFIKTGDPNGEGVPTWPSADDMSYQFIDWNCISYDASSPIDQMIIEHYITTNNLEGYFA